MFDNKVVLRTRRREDDKYFILLQDILKASLKLIKTLLTNLVVMILSVSSPNYFSNSFPLKCMTLS